MDLGRISKSMGTATPENTGEQRMLKIDDYIYREIINDSVVFESQYDLIIREDSLYADQTLIVFPSGYEEGILVNKYQLRRVETGTLTWRCLYRKSYRC